MIHEIIVVTCGLYNGGAERVISELIEVWERRGYRVIIFQLNPYLYEDKYTISKTVEIINAGKSISFFSRFHYAEKLVKLLRSHPNASVISMLNYEHSIVALCSPFIKNKIILAERCDPTHWPAKASRRKIRNLLFHVAHVCIFQTQEAKSYFSHSIQSKGVIIPNPINPHLPAKYVGVKRKVIVAACRLTKQKNLPMLIDSYSMLVKDYPEYVLEIYGRGEDEAFLREYIFKKNLEQTVLLKGFARDIYDIMNRCSMYVSTSDYEGISNSMLEAMALGLPVVVTDCPIGGARMAIQDGINGLLVPVGDVQAMYRAMKRVIDEPGMAERLGNEAYKVRERFAIEKIAKQWLDVIEEGES